MFDLDPKMLLVILIAVLLLGLITSKKILNIISTIVRSTVNIAVISLLIYVAVHYWDEITIRADQVLSELKVWVERI